MRASLILIALVSTQALAGGSTTVDSDTAQQQQSQSVSQTSVDTSNHSRTSYPKNRQVGYAVGPALTSSIDACLGSYSAGFGVYGFGLGAGKTYLIKSCDIRKDAETSARMGLVAEAKEVMCSSTRFFKASIRAGRPCFPEEEMIDELTDTELSYFNSIQEHNALGFNPTEKHIDQMKK